MSRSLAGRIAGRMAYALRSAQEILPLLRETAPLTVLRLLAAQVLVRRRTFDVRIEGVALRVRSHSSDVITARACLTTEFESAFAAAEGLPGAVVDAGGHIGSAAIAFARRWPERRIVTVEPSAENFALLARNVAPWPNVTAVNAALGAADGTLTLVDRTGDGDGYSLAREAGGGAGETVEVVSMETLMARHGIGEVALLKLDIEGAER